MLPKAGLVQGICFRFAFVTARRRCLDTGELPVNGDLACKVAAFPNRPPSLAQLDKQPYLYSPSSSLKCYKLRTSPSQLGAICPHKPSCVSFRKGDLMKRKRLGEVLSERGHISPSDLAKALRERQGKVIHLGELLLQRKLVNKDQLLAALNEVSRVDYLDARSLNPSPELLRILPASLAKRCSAIPVQRNEKI